MENEHAEPVTWWQVEPRRLRRDQEDIAKRFPDLQWQAAGAGGWMGHLPRWPFIRPEPAGLLRVIGEKGLLAAVAYGHAYPMVAPTAVPVDPEPPIRARTDQRWHVMGDGSLCLLQDDATWTGRDSVVELLLKAAGWRVEFELMRRGLIEAMTVDGIVDDDQLDYLLRDLVAGESDGLANAKTEPGAADG
jgi:hypothetical protein